MRTTTAGILTHGCVLIALSGCSNPQAPVGTPHAMLPIDQERAVLLTTDADVPSVTLTDARLGIRWRTRLPVHIDATRPLVLSRDRAPISVGAHGALVSLSRREGGVETFSLDLEDGEVRWRAALGMSTTVASDRVRQWLFDGVAVTSIDESEGRPHLIAREAHSGRTLWESSLVRDGRLSWLTPTEPARIAAHVERLDGTNTLFILEVATGRIEHELSFRGVRVSLAGASVFYVADGGRTIHRVALDDLADSIVSDASGVERQEAADDVTGEVVVCGRRGSESILGILHRGSGRLWTELVAVDDATSRIAGRWAPGIGDITLVPALTPRGELPRFVPVLSPEDDALVILDLDAKAIASRSKPLRDLRLGNAVQAGPNTLIAVGDLLFVVDGATGSVTGAVRIPSVASAALRPHHVAAKHLFVQAGKGVAILDADTLALRSTLLGRVDVQDGHRDLAQLLGFATAD